MLKRIKLTFENDNRILSTPATFSDFSSKVMQTFSLPNLDNFNIYYMDADGDLIIVTNQDDYELAFEQADGKLHFYVGASTDKVKESIIAKPAAMEQVSIPKCSIVQSEYTENKAPMQDMEASSYACLGCEGRKTNKKGTKPCRICGGTGMIPQAFIDKLKDIAKSELMAEIGSRIEVARTQVVEEQKKVEKVNMAKSIANPIVYKIDAPKKAEPGFKVTSKSESLKDGYETAPGAIFEKVWVMKNTGVIAWPESTVFKKTSSDQIEANTAHVGSIKPGETAEIKITVKAPVKPGHYACFFRLTYDNNKMFGENPWIDFIVVDPANKP